MDRPGRPAFDLLAQRPVISREARLDRAGKPAVRPGAFPDPSIPEDDEQAAALAGIVHISKTAD
jgi:hypothetical protein